MDESRKVVAGAIAGALIGAAAGYLFFTDAGKRIRDRMEPAVDDLRREFTRYQNTIQKLGEMANEGMRMMSEFNAARAQSSSFPGSGTSH